MKKIIICGAAGRDFHNFNVLYRHRKDVRVAAFTAAQIPDIDGRWYPPELAGPHYPQGIPIHSEGKLSDLIREQGVGEVVFSYSDVSHDHVMSVGSVALAAGANFILLSPAETMLQASKPVVSVCAVRTGAGKSQTSRAVADILTRRGWRVAAVRHPMPYGDLKSQKVQRFSEMADLDRHRCTIEEREEYEPHIRSGRVIYAGVDYDAILRQAEQEADIILWDGGNNDTPFYRSDLEIVVVDPHRPGHELRYYPGRINFLRADVIVINKIDSAKAEDVEAVEKNIQVHNPAAQVIKARSRVDIDRPQLIEGKRVLVVEDGPTLTHGEMKYGAGVVAARKCGARAVIDPRPWTVGRIKATYQDYPDIGPLLPAMGYGEKQVRDLEETIDRVECDTVIIATPVDLSRLITIRKPMARVTYELEQGDLSTLAAVLERAFGQP